MPAFLTTICIDWHYASASAALQQVLPAIDAQLRSTDHTWTTFRDQLAQFVATQPTAVVDALTADEYRAYSLLRARDGKLTHMKVEEQPVGGNPPSSLPYDELITVTLVRDVEVVRGALEEFTDLDDVDDDAYDTEVAVPLSYPDIDTLHRVVDLLARAIDVGGGSYVAEVNTERFLVDIKPGQSLVRPLAVVTEPPLVARLLQHDYIRVPPPPRDAAEKYSAGLYWPESLLLWLQSQASRTDRSLSYLVQFAYKHAHAQIEASDYKTLAAAAKKFDGDKRKQTLYFPGAILDAIEAQARRIDSSVSLVAQAAVVLSQPAIAQLPAASAS